MSMDIWRHICVDASMATHGSPRYSKSNNSGWGKKKQKITKQPQPGIEIRNGNYPILDEERAGATENSFWTLSWLAYFDTSGVLAARPGN